MSVKDAAGGGEQEGERLVRTGVVKRSLLVELWLVSELCGMISLIHTFLIISSLLRSSLVFAFQFSRHVPS